MTKGTTFRRLFCMKVIIFLLLSFGVRSSASQLVWPGDGGKICLDTPKPSKFAELDYKVVSTYDQSRRKELLKNLENRSELFRGPLTVQIDDGEMIELPEKKGIYISDLDPSKEHSLKIKNKNGKSEQVIKFKFEKPSDPRIRISQGTFYHNKMQINPPPKKCPWTE